MPIIPNFVERLALRFNLAPGPMLDVLGAASLRPANSAIRLGLFQALAGGSLTAEELAMQIDADERGTRALLEFLAASGYIRRHRGHYSNSAMTKKWMLSSSPDSLAAFVSWWDTHALPRWGDLEDSVRRGAPEMSLYDWLDEDPARWLEAQAGWKDTVRLESSSVVAKVGLPASARTLIDIGGGHGHLSIEFCRRHPELSATIFDRAGPLEAARETIAAAEMGDRIAVQEGDVWVDDLGSDYDAALLSNIVHAFRPEQNVELMRKAHQALRPGGSVAILEQLDRGSPSAMMRGMKRLLDLLYVGELGSQLYRYEEIAHWLTAAGFEQVRLKKGRGSDLILATKRLAS